jgi:transcriptional regulator with XRE-family HTH domain
MEMIFLRQWLKEARDNVGMNQEQAAKASGITRPAYNMIENGVRNPSVPVAQRIADALGIEWTYFFAIQGNKTTRQKREAAR